MTQACEGKINPFKRWVVERIQIPLIKKSKKPMNFIIIFLLIGLSIYAFNNFTFLQFNQTGSKILNSSEFNTHLEKKGWQLKTKNGIKELKKSDGLVSQNHYIIIRDTNENVISIPVKNENNYLYLDFGISLEIDTEISLNLIDYQQNILYNININHQRIAISTIDEKIKSIALPYFNPSYFLRTEIIFSNEHLLFSIPGYHKKITLNKKLKPSIEILELKPVKGLARLKNISIKSSRTLISSQIDTKNISDIYTDKNIENSLIQTLNRLEKNLNDEDIYYALTRITQSPAYTLGRLNIIFSDAQKLDHLFNVIKKHDCEPTLYYLIALNNNISFDKILFNPLKYRKAFSDRPKLLHSESLSQEIQLLSYMKYLEINDKESSNFILQQLIDQNLHQDIKDWASNTSLQPQP